MNHFNTAKSIRLIDLFLSLFGFILLMPLISILGAICFIETGRMFFKQERIGKYKKPFYFVKFQTMKIDAPSVPTHLIDTSYISRSGRLLRRTKLDELPQLFNVIKGDMSFVGPRPCLPIQHELIEERDKRGIFNYLPGITGLAQINNVDMADPYLLAEYDSRLVKSFNIKNYFLYILLTAAGKGQGDRINIKK